MSPESQVIKLRGLKQLGHQTGWMAMKVGKGVCIHHLYVFVCVCERERENKSRNILRHLPRAFTGRVVNR